MSRIVAVTQKAWCENGNLSYHTILSAAGSDGDVGGRAFQQLVTGKKLKEIFAMHLRRRRQLYCIVSCFAPTE